MKSRDWKIIQGRMGYEFSTCFGGSALVFKKIVNKFEKSHTCAARYGFELFIQLEKQPDLFRLDDIHYRFLNVDNNPVLSDVLEPRGLTVQEMRAIEDKTSEISDRSESILAMQSIADLFKLYLVSNLYKSVIVSTIVNYGVDATMSHQCSIVALGHPHNVLLFYEPYGLYAKFGIPYKHCLVRLLSIFTESVEGLSQYRCTGYHEYFMLRQGIQGMMIDQGRMNRDIFLSEYNRIKGIMGASEPWKYENDEYDSTFAVSTLMSKVSNSPRFVEDAAVLYGQHSAKTCVSIFLVESARLLHELSTGSDLGSIRLNLRRWYGTFSSNATSMLLSELVIMIGALYANRKEIFAAFRNPANSASDICKYLTVPLDNLAKN